MSYYSPTIKFSVFKRIDIKERVDIKIDVDVDLNGDNKALATASADAEPLFGDVAGTATNTSTTYWSSKADSLSQAITKFESIATGESTAKAYGDGTFADAETTASWSLHGLSSDSFSQSATDYS